MSCEHEFNITTLSNTVYCKLCDAEWLPKEKCKYTDACLTELPKINAYCPCTCHRGEEKPLGPETFKKMVDEEIGCYNECHCGERMTMGLPPRCPKCEPEEKPEHPLAKYGRLTLEAINEYYPEVRTSEPEKCSLCGEDRPCRSEIINKRLDEERKGEPERDTFTKEEIDERLKAVTGILSDIVETLWKDTGIDHGGKIGTFTSRFL